VLIVLVVSVVLDVSVVAVVLPELTVTEALLESLPLPSPVLAVLAVLSLSEPLVTSLVALLEDDPSVVFSPPVHPTVVKLTVSPSPSEETIDARIRE